MEPIIISQSQYEAGDYPKGVPIMVGMDVGMDGKGGLLTNKKEPTRIQITLKTA